jgi:predicted nucleic acid-binding protein
VAAWVDAQVEQDVFLSRVTLAEVRAGVERMADIARRSDLQAWLDTELRQRFAGRILEVDEPVILAWLLLMEEGRKGRRPPPQPDALLAATALVHNLAIATRNAKDFRQIGLQVVNPWNAVP